MSFPLFPPPPHLLFSLTPVCVWFKTSALRKTSHILSALSKLVPEGMSPAPITYYALDLEQRELSRTLDQLAASPVGAEIEGKVDSRGLWGTYEGGLKFVEEGGLRGRNIPVAAAARIRSLSADSAATQPSSPSSSERDSVETSLSTPDLTTLDTPLHILFLGSSLGNFSRGEDAAFLKSLPLRAGRGDTLLLGLDHGSDGPRIERAYNDRAGITRRFILNGLKGAGRALGDENLFAPERWEYVGRYNAEERQSAMLPWLSTLVRWLTPLISNRSRLPRGVLSFSRRADGARSSIPNGVCVPCGRACAGRILSQGLFIDLLPSVLVLTGTHFKKISIPQYTERDAYRLFTEANLRPLRCWTDSDSGYSLWLLERPPFNFRLLQSPASVLSNTPFGVPSLQDFEEMWAAWDFITQKMIPDSMMFEKPIDLRHICLFYTGHIPTFLDIHLSRLLGEPHTEPEHFKVRFSPIP